MAEKPMKLDSDEMQAAPVKKKDVATAAEPTAESNNLSHRQGDQVRPYCRLHHVLMRAAKTSNGVTSYKCPAQDCKETAKQSQPRSVIPREPQECPKCRQRNAEQDANGKAPVYCQVDFGRSTSGNLMLACPMPECDFHVLVPRPDIAARSRRMRVEEELTAG